jgi:hypothetical protein
VSTVTRLSEDFVDDLAAMSDAAFRLHVEALVWSNRHGLDLRIPRGDLDRTTQAPAAAQELIEAGMWFVIDDHFFIVHSAFLQPTNDTSPRRGSHD